jgi:hypothetical protein
MKKSGTWMTGKEFWAQKTLKNPSIDISSLRFYLFSKLRRNYGEITEALREVRGQFRLAENRWFRRSEVPNRVAALQLFTGHNSHKAYQALGQRNKDLKLS